MKTRSMLGVVAVGVLVLVASLQAAEKKDKLAKIKCPVSGKSVKAASFAEYKGGKVYFCCDNCPKAFAKNTEKFAAKANHQLVATSQAKQAKCPLTGRKLNPATKITINGVDVCFCCNGCKGKVNKSDDKIAMVFADKAFDKGFTIKKKEEK